MTNGTVVRAARTGSGDACPESTGNRYGDASVETFSASPAVPAPPTAKENVS